MCYLKFLGMKQNFRKSDDQTRLEFLWSATTISEKDEGHMKMWRTEWL